MIKLELETLKLKKAFVKQLDDDFDLWKPHFQEIAKYLLPRRYTWLTNSAANTQPASKIPPSNTSIIDPTATIAARVLANGLVNGVTSPARPWFRLRLKEFPQDVNYYPIEYIRWLEECTRRMLIVLAESNYYNSQAVQYLELVGFGTGAMLLYDDFEDIIRCYNSPMGEYRLFQDNRRVVVGMARHFHMSTGQLVSEFGLENLSDTVQNQYKTGGAALLRTHAVTHLIEPNEADTPGAISSTFKYREFFWESTANTGQVLRVKGYRDKPIVAPRWELLGNDTYGTSPTQDALPDIKQLQFESKQKAQGIDRMNKPPLLIDQTLKGNPGAFLPGGQSYVKNVNSFGAKPVYTVNPPVGEISQDISNIQIRIREIYYNHLFRNVSSLETVRSAAEIYERKSEDMLMLGGVLERFQGEALDPVIRRTFNVMNRKGLFPEPPAGLDVATLDIQYVSILADAQRSAGTGSIERFLQMTGELSASRPEIMAIPDYDELVRIYAEQLNVPSSGIKSRDEVQATREAEQEQLDLQQGALIGKDLTDAAKNLSDTDVGGGQNAIQALMGG